MLTKIWRVLAPYWKGEDRVKGAGLLLLSVLFSLTIVFFQYLLTKWNQGFYDAIQKMDAHGFFHSLKIFVLIAAGYVAAAVAQFYFSQLFSLRWREWLTHHCLSRWLAGGNHYFWNHLTDGRVDNPDQRISDDVRDFVSGCVSLGLDLFQQVVTLVTFIVMLWTLGGSYKIHGHAIPGFMVWASLIYALAGTGISHWIGKRIAPLNYRQQTFEADFRFHLIRIRENSESVLLMKGEGAERKQLNGTFSKVVANFRALIDERKKLGVFTYAYSVTASVFPILISAPKYFAKEITMGQIFQTASAFGRVNDAMSWVVNSYSTLAEWSAVVNRLYGFFGSMDRAQELRKSTEKRFSPTEGSASGAPDELAAEGLQIRFPGAREPLSAVSAKVRSGDSLMVVGPSGVGKSTLLRVFARIWPYFSGRISLPRSDSLLMIPQKPYMPLGTLREVLMYPDDPLANPANEKELVELMNFCGLEKLVPALDAREQWGLVLSPGEQQRVGWVRAFLKRPAWLFLDEATSALDEKMQAKLYGALPERLPRTTVVSVAHRKELGTYHGQLLELKEPVLQPAAQAEPQPVV